MAEWSVDVTGLAETQERLQTLSTRLRPRLIAVMAGQLTEAVQYARQRYLSGGTTSDRLAQRTGGMAQALGSDVQSSGEGVVGRIGYLNRTPPGASVHEGLDGRSSTTIRPRNSKYLALPLPSAGLAPGGAVGGPRTLHNSFVARSRAGSLIVFQRTASGIEPRYLLRAQVTVPARPAIQPTVHTFLPRIREGIAQAVADTLGGR